MKPKFLWFKSRRDLATKTDLKELERNIMSAISDAVEQVNGLLTQIDTGLTGIEGDLATLAKRIQELIDAGTTSPEDLEKLNAMVAAIGTRVAKIQALDEQNPPA